ncbi:MAG: hypothetical protein ACRDJH_25530 [Thermomicrobiales bacterium]
MTASSSDGSGESAEQSTPHRGNRLPEPGAGDVTDEEIAQYFAELDQFIAEIAKPTPKGLTAADVIADIRRDFAN